MASATPPRAKKIKSNEAPKTLSTAALEARVLADARHANDVLDLLERSEQKATVAHDAIHALHRIFVAKSAHLQHGADPLHEWLHAQFLELVLVLLRVVGGPSVPLQIPAVRILCDFAALQSHTAPRSAVQLLERTLKALLLDTHERDAVLETFATEYIARFDDIRYYSLQLLARVAGERVAVHTVAAAPPAAVAKGNALKLVARDRRFVVNAYTLLDALNMPSDSEAPLSALFFAPVGSGGISTYAGHRKVYTECWRQFLQLQLPVDIYKAVLARMNDDILPHLTDPKWLIDFLRDSYSLGGCSAVLALDALFELIQAHNLDLPEFFPKLYRLVTPGMLLAKYRPRFFRLLDKFLGSSHLPNYLVAAFIKQLSRISLTAPPGGALVAQRLVFNLLKRHPACMFLIHRADERDSGVFGDPFDAETINLIDTRAQESSLWETRTLLNHYHHEVARLPLVFESPYLRKSEMDVARASTASYSSLVQAEVRAAAKEGAAVPAVTFARPTSVFATTESFVY